MRFAFIDAWGHQWRVATLCRVMRVSERGYRQILETWAWTTDQHACTDRYEGAVDITYVWTTEVGSTG